MLLSGDVNYYYGGRTTVNGRQNFDLQRNSRVGITMARPLSGGRMLRVAVSRGAYTTSARTLPVSRSPSSGVGRNAIAWRFRMRQYLCGLCITSASCLRWPRALPVADAATPDIADGRGSRHDGSGAESARGALGSGLAQCDRRGRARRRRRRHRHAHLRCVRQHEHRVPHERGRPKDPRRSRGQDPQPRHLHHGSSRDRHRSSAASPMSARASTNGELGSTPISPRGAPIRLRWNAPATTPLAAMAS